MVTVTGERMLFENHNGGYYDVEIEPDTSVEEQIDRWTGSYDENGTGRDYWLGNFIYDEERQALIERWKQENGE
jgi:hypothetical protein